MEQCVICLSNSKKLISVEETEKSTCKSYADMITSIVVFKFGCDNTNSSKVCRLCCKKLIECYNFKLLIQRNVAPFQERDNHTKLYFNTLEDIKIKVEIDGEPAIPTNNLLGDKFNKGDIVCYGETVITKTVREEDDHFLSVPIQAEVVDHLELLINENDLSDTDMIDGFDGYNDFDDAEPPYKDGDSRPTWDEMSHMHSDNDIPINEKDKENASEHNKRYNTRYSSGKNSKITDTDSGDENMSILEKYKKMKKEERKQSRSWQSHRKSKDIDSDDDYIPQKSFLKEYLPKKYLPKKYIPQKNDGPRRKRDNTKYESTKVCIKPVYLHDLDMVNTTPNLSKPRKKSEISRICPHCGTMVKKIYLSQHLKIHMSKVPKVKKYKCEHCDKGYESEQKLKKHNITHGPKQLKCDQCPATFWLTETLRHHMTIHSDEKKYICNTCEKSFKRRCNMRRHMLKHDFSNKNTKCDLCEMTFFDVYQLRHHMRVHTRERPYCCEICAQPYSYKRDFNRHCFNKHGVFLKHRSERVMNEEILERELATMNQLKNRINEASIDDVPLPFEGPTAFKAFEMAVEALKTGTAKF